MKKPMITPKTLALVAITLSVAACGGGPGESDFVAACLAERSLSESECECAASEAKSKMSARAYQAMILEMSGQHREASEIMQSLPEDEQEKAVEATLETFGRCVLGE